MILLDQDGNIINGIPLLTQLVYKVNEPKKYEKLKQDWRLQAPNVWVYDINLAKADVRKKIFDACDAKLNEVLLRYPANEPLTWVKIAQAKQWLAMNSSEQTAALSDLSYSLIFNEAVKKLTPTTTDKPAITAVCNRIKKSEIVFSVYSGRILNMKTAMESALNALTDPDAVANFEISYPLNLSAVNAEVETALNPN
jgi:hypothetical protein